LEQARLRLSQRFSEKWPAPTAKFAIKNEAAVLRHIKTQDFSLLEAARQRVRDRFLAKWPDSDVKHSFAPTVGKAEHSPQFGGLEHLEAARFRLRARFLRRWPHGKASTVAEFDSTVAELDDFHEFEDESTLPEIADFSDASLINSTQVQKKSMPTLAAGKQQPHL